MGHPWRASLPSDDGQRKSGRRATRHGKCSRVNHQTPGPGGENSVVVGRAPAARGSGPRRSADELQHVSTGRHALSPSGCAQGCSSASASRDTARSALSRTIASRSRSSECQLLRHGLTRTTPRRCRFGNLEVEDPLDQRRRPSSSIDSSRKWGEALVAPVRAHLRVDEVLVDRGQLTREDVVGGSMISSSPVMAGDPTGQAATMASGAGADLRRPSMYGWQPPHRMPAPQRDPTSSTVSAPGTRPRPSGR
jgi:hypothetical protein